LQFFADSVVPVNTDPTTSFLTLARIQGALGAYEVQVDQPQQRPRLRPLQKSIAEGQLAAVPKEEVELLQVDEPTGQDASLPPPG
jgi:hypothetical protein